MSIQSIQNHAIYQSPREICGIQKHEAVANPAAPDDKPSNPATQDDKPSKLSGKSAYDEYIPGEKHEASGLYKMTQNDEGAPGIYFDDPMKAGGSSPKAAEKPAKQAASAKKEPERNAETCTINTDRVDREIEKLKEEKDQLETQIRTTKDPKKAEESERRLALVENELRQKDNDTYRRQNAVIS